MNIAYIRVSTIEQNEAQQVEALEKNNIEKWFTEKVSAKDTHRPELQNLIEFAREGDTVYVHDFSRLARSTKDLLSLVESFKNKGVILISNKENIDGTAYACNNITYNFMQRKASKYFGKSISITRYTGSSKKRVFLW